MRAVLSGRLHPLHHTTSLPTHTTPETQIPHGPQIGARRRERLRGGGGGRIRVRLHGPLLPRAPGGPLRLPPAAAHAPEAAVQPRPPLADGRLLAHPPHLLRRRLRPRVRRHRRAPRHRQLAGPGHRRRPPRRLPPRPRQRPVHHRGPLLRLHVPPRRRRHHPPRPRRRPQPPRLLRRRRGRRRRHRLRHGHALPPHQDTRLPMKSASLEASSRPASAGSSSLQKLQDFCTGLHSWWARAGPQGRAASMGAKGVRPLLVCSRLPLHLFAHSGEEICQLGCIISPSICRLIKLAEAARFLYWAA